MWQFMNRPEYMVLFIFAMFITIYGFLTCTPILGYGLNTPSPSSWGLEVQVAAGVYFTLSGLATLFGYALRKKIVIMNGALSMFCCFLFASILRILTYGLDPLGWLIFLFLAVVVGACRLCLESKNTS